MLIFTPPPAGRMHAICTPTIATASLWKYYAGSHVLHVSAGIEKALKTQINNGESQVGVIEFERARQI